MTRIKPKYTLLIACTAIAVLPACSDKFFYHESYVSESKVQLQESDFYQEVPIDQVGDAYLSALATTYTKHGGDGLKVTVTYDPESQLRSGHVATSELARITSNLHAQGVRDVYGDVLPIHGKGDQATVIVSYMSYDAQEPEDCTMMPGIENSYADYDKDYKLGCTNETYFARQIARPHDLKGDASSPDIVDGRAASNVIEPVRAGVRNEPLGGQSASGEN